MFKYQNQTLTLNPDNPMQIGGVLGEFVWRFLRNLPDNAVENAITRIMFNDGINVCFQVRLTNTDTHTFKHKGLVSPSDLLSKWESRNKVVDLYGHHIHFDRTTVIPFHSVASLEIESIEIIEEKR